MSRGRHGGRSGWVEFGRYLVRSRSRSSRALKLEVVRPWISRARDSDEGVVFSSFFFIYTHSITMTKTENGDFALIFFRKASN